MVEFIKEFALQQKKRLTTIVKDKTSTSDVEKNKDRAQQYSDEAKEVMKKWLNDVSQGGIHRLRLDYNKLKSFTPKGLTQNVFEANKNRCRYKDVKCFDQTRVILSWPPGQVNDFIHANWVKHELLENDFICCQAPLESTVGDFWRMIWQEKVKQIIMLCSLFELGKMKCCQYWPPRVDDKMTFFTITITCTLVDTSDPSFVHTKLDLTCGEEVRHVDHRQWITWPDKSVPKTPMAPFRLLQYSRHFVKNPSVVHCSAGIGRTGTLVLLEITTNALKRGIFPDIKQYFRDLRSQRSQAIQTEDQYLYIHYAIVQLLFIKGVVSAHDIRGFCSEYVEYLKMLNENGGKQLPLDKTAPPKIDSRDGARADKIAALIAEDKKVNDSQSIRRRKKTMLTLKESNDDKEETSSKRQKKKKGKIAKDKRGSDSSSKRVKKATETSSKRAKKISDLLDKGSLRQRKKEAALKDKGTTSPGKDIKYGPTNENQMIVMPNEFSKEPLAATAVHTNKPPVEAKAPNARIAYTPAKVYTVVQAGTNKVTVFKCPATTVGLRTTREIFDDGKQTK
uniref:Tyrosine-protein phosphatase non-receptor type 12 n=1 Tax=Ascaris suum TaxID=6253 RepID=F1L1L7_ASCSU